MQPPTRCLENGREAGSSMAAADLFWKQRDAESLTFADKHETPATFTTQQTVPLPPHWVITLARWVFGTTG